MCHDKKIPIKERILDTALELFLKQGYNETSVSQILKEASASRSAFYHYYHSKEELLFSMAYTYDDAYVEWFRKMPSDIHTVEKLKSYHTFVMERLDSSPHRPLFEARYSHQVATPDVRHIINPGRKYFQIMNLILKEGMVKKEIQSSSSCRELCDMITLYQIGFTYSWLLKKCSFPLVSYSQKVLYPFLDSLRV